MDGVGARLARPRRATNDRSGSLHIARSVIRENHGGSWYVLPGISMHEDTEYTVDDASILE